MQRPPSIVTFERCYIGAWLLGLLNLALTWNTRATLAAALATSRGVVLPRGMESIILIGIAFGVVIGAVITLLLWWFVARRASDTAKWIVVAFFAIGVLGMISSVVNHSFVGGVAGVLTIVVWVLQAVAVAMLFRPDAKAWLAPVRSAGRGA